MTSLGETRDLRRCVTSPPSNGVAKKLASNGKLSVSGALRADDVMASVRRGWLPSETSAASVDDSTQVRMFVKNSRVKFQLGGQDDELHDVVTRDVTASV